VNRMRIVDGMHRHERSRAPLRDTNAHWYRSFVFSLYLSATIDLRSTSRTGSSCSSDADGSGAGRRAAAALLLRHGALRRCAIVVVVGVARRVVPLDRVVVVRYPPPPVICDFNSDR
jgi:hypothetical protein